MKFILIVKAINKEGVLEQTREQAIARFAPTIQNALRRVHFSRLMAETIFNGGTIKVEGSYRGEFPSRANMQLETEDKWGKA